jgi:hypothetical protein
MAMKQIDLDDLPPRAAEVFAGLTGEEELVLVRGGRVVARLRVSAAPEPAVEPPTGEDAMKEVMEHFNDMIHDEF